MGANYSGATFSIAAEDANAVAFGDIANAGTRNALYCDPGIPEFAYNIWHIPGTTGDVVCNLGESSRTIVLTAVYIGEYPGILGTYEDDKINFAGVPCTIIDTANKTHDRCRLKASRSNEPPRGTTTGANAANAIAFFTVQFAFDRHGVTT